MPTPAQKPTTGWRQSIELLRQLTIREIAESVKGSALGVLWLLFNPLLSMALYVIVFGVLFGGRFGKVPDESSIAYAVGVYIGLTVVSLVNDTIGKATTNLQRQANLIRKVVFPLELLPVVQTADAAFRFGVNALLWLAMGAAFGTVLSPGVLLLPVILLPLVALALGLAALFSAVSVYLRDIQQVTHVLTQIVFWSSGVFYSSAKVMEVPQLWAFLKWNPVLLAVENIRAVTLWGLPPDYFQIGYLYAVGALVLAAGLLVFTRLKGGFADYL
jgi:lipopolysaccharide transport system permease protein